MKKEAELKYYSEMLAKTMQQKLETVMQTKPVIAVDSQEEIIARRRREARE